MAKCFDNLISTEDNCTQINWHNYSGRVWILAGSTNGDVFAQFKSGDRSVVEKFMVNEPTGTPSEVGPNNFHCYDMSLIEPLTGTVLAGDTESGRRLFKKTVSLRIPVRNYEAVSTVLMPLITNRNGFIIIAETNSPDLLGSYRVFGAYDKCVVDVAGVTQNEYENGGDWVVPFTCVETYPDIFFADERFTLKGDLDNWLNDMCTE